MRGGFNVVTCPNCRFQSMVATPIVYHDPSKELLLTFVPMELGLPQAEQERMLGSLTQVIVNSMPPEKRKGYLLRPSQTLSLQGMIDRVLEADGITPEMLAEQRAKMQLIQQFLSATSEEALRTLANENDAKLDYAFFELFTAAVQAAAESGDRNATDQMLAIRNKVVELSSLGKESAARAQKYEDVANELNGLGNDLTPEKFFDLVVNADSEDRIIALVSLARPLVDYAFFTKLTALINNAQSERRDALTRMRELILETVGQVDQVAQAQAQQSTGILKALVEAPDLKKAVAENIRHIDNSFMAVLSQNYEAARKAGNKELADRFQQIGDAVLEMIRSAAPPEIKLINEFLSIESEEEAIAEVKRRAAEFTPEVVEAMKAIEEELSAGDRKEVLERLTKLRSVAEREAMMAKWK